MDLIQATNAPVPLELAGSNYPARALKFKEWGAFQAWLERALPNPIARAVRALDQLRASGTPADPATEELVLDHAQKEAAAWPPRVGSKAWLDAVDAAPSGLAELVRACLAPTNPAFDAAAAEALAERLAAPDVVRLVNLCVFGVRDPKAPGPPAEAAPAAPPPPPPADDGWRT